MLKCINCTNAQTNYQAFPDSGMIWNVQAQACCYAGGCGMNDPVITDYLYSYIMEGDTTINNILYHKIYRSGRYSEHCSLNSPTNWVTINKEFTGAFREDINQKKVYFWYSYLSQECLLYDFSLSVGDTLGNMCDNTAYSYHVTSIDSILIGNAYHKRFNFNCSNNSIIEGIGCTAGLLEPLCPFEFLGNLKCVSINNNTVYPDNITNCEIITKEHLPEETKKVMIAPNPFSESTSISFGKELFNVNIQIINLIGQEIRSYLNVSGSNLQISRNELNSGLYFIKLIQNNRIISVEKVSVIDSN